MIALKVQGNFLLFIGIVPGPMKSSLLKSTPEILSLIHVALLRLVIGDLRGPIYRSTGKPTMLPHSVQEPS